MNWTFFIMGICFGILLNIDTISECISRYIKR